MFEENEQYHCFVQPVIHVFVGELVSIKVAMTTRLKLYYEHTGNTKVWWYSQKAVGKYVQAVQARVGLRDGHGGLVAYPILDKMLYSDRS